MSENEEIQRLKSRLQWEAGPLADLSSRGLEALIAGVSTVAGQLREAAEDRPLVSLLLAFQLGFAAGRWGPRRAHR